MKNELRWGFHGNARIASSAILPALGASDAGRAVAIAIKCVEPGSQMTLKRRAEYESGHSILPCQEAFPRYGSFVGFNPLTDPRLMWHNVLGAGGVRELLWLERAENCICNFLDSSTA
jgi:SIS domain-containing protein